MNYLTRKPQDSEDQHNLSNINSVFLQDRWTVLSTVDLYLGLRVDDYKASGEMGEIIGLKKSGVVEDTAFSPKLGIYFSPIPEIDTFATAARATKFPIIPKYYWYYAGWKSNLPFLRFFRVLCYGWQRNSL